MVNVHCRSRNSIHTQTSDVLTQTASTEVNIPHIVMTMIKMMSVAFFKHMKCRKF